MSTQVMFGKTGANAKPQALSTAAPVPQANQPPATSAPDNPYHGLDNLNDVDFGRTFSMPYAQGKSMLVVFVLWLLTFGSGGHRFYLGDKMIGLAMAAVGIFNGVLWLTGGFTAYLSYKAGNGLLSGGLVSAVVVMIVHMGWSFFDFFYILVRKFTSR